MYKIFYLLSWDFKSGKERLWKMDSLLITEEVNCEIILKFVEHLLAFLKQFCISSNNLNSE